MSDDGTNQGWGDGRPNGQPQPQWSGQPGWQQAPGGQQAPGWPQQPAPAWQQGPGWQQQPGWQPPRPIPLDEAGVPPLWAPWYGAGIGDAIGRFFRKYARFDGRASRSEFWWWFLTNAIIAALLGAVVAIIVTTTGTREWSTDVYGRTTSQLHTESIWWLVPIWIWAAWFLGTAVGNIALMVRRLHDVNLSGFFAFFFVNTLGWIVLWVMAMLSPNPNGQRFDRPQG
ncbi:MULTISPECIES: DUF805 domain-containing protein [unclassified Curtobacterium]|uniref:DUF805 domain-containing protein n=1 Tax=unclassified Curtobacterium TaxID=257496 RepID=UPI0038198D62